MAKRPNGSIVASGITLRQDRFDDIIFTLDSEDNTLSIEGSDGTVWIDPANVDLFVEAVKRTAATSEV